MNDERNELTRALNEEARIRDLFSRSLGYLSSGDSNAEESLQELRNIVVGDDGCEKNPVSAYLMWISLNALARTTSGLPVDVFAEDNLSKSSDIAEGQTEFKSRSKKAPGGHPLRRLSGDLGTVFATSLYDRGRSAGLVNRTFLDLAKNWTKSREGFVGDLTSNQGSYLGLLACMLFSGLEPFLKPGVEANVRTPLFERGQFLSSVQTLILILDRKQVADNLEAALKNDSRLKELDPFGAAVPPSRQLFLRYETALNRLFAEVPSITADDQKRLKVNRAVEDALRPNVVPTAPNNGLEYPKKSDGTGPAISPALISETLLESLQRMIAEEKCAIIPITETHQVYADKKDGRILGPMGEGTSAIVLFGKRRSGVAIDPNQIGFAVRVPKLSTGNNIQNFENAETCYLEHAQAHSIYGHGSLSVPIDSGCLHRLLKIDNIQSLNIEPPPAKSNDLGSEELLVALNMSPGLPPRVGIVTRSFIWPNSLALALAQAGAAPGAIFEELSKAMLQSRQRHEQKSTSSDAEMPPMVLVRELGNEDQEIDDRGFTYIGRDQVQTLYAREKMSGWVFGVPFMVCDWMTADLHRLMSGLVGSHGRATEAERMIQNVRDQRLKSWFNICALLCEGLDSLHTLVPSGEPTRVHGDVRPANVMFLRGSNFLQCRWIDIGSGSVTARERRLTQTRRTSIFYAWERTEHVSEENDQVEFSINPSGAKEKYNISFLFRDDNLKQATPVNLRGADSGTRSKLSLLLPGDRLVIGGEFIFRVKQLYDAHVEVDKAWEIASGQIPVETEISELFRRREHKSISEFKILWQWGAASDIYGMGMIVLFVFYMRGLYGLTQFDDTQGSQEAKVSPVDVEEGFAKLLSAIRTDGFLGAFLRSLNVSPETKSAASAQRDAVQFCKKEALFELPQEVVQYVRTQRNDGVQTNKDDPLSDDPQVKKLIDIVEELRVFAPELENVFFGVNSNPAVFTMLMYIVLSCLWRRDEIDRLSKSVVEGVEEVDFQPYCASRMIGKGNEGTAPSKILLRDLQTIESHLGADPLSRKLYNSAQPIVEAGGSNKQVTGNLFNVVRAQRGEIERLRLKAGEALGELDRLNLGIKSANPGVRLKTAELASGMPLRTTLQKIRQKLQEMQQLSDGEGIISSED